MESPEGTLDPIRRRPSGRPSRPRYTPPIRRPPRHGEAPRAWRDFGLASDEARCALDMAILPSSANPEVSAAAAAAREILARFETTPFIAWLETPLAPSSDRTGHSAAPKMASRRPS